MNFRGLSSTILRIFLYSIVISSILEFFLQISQNHFNPLKPLEKKFANLVYLRQQVTNLTTIFYNRAKEHRERFISNSLSQIKNYQIEICKINYDLMQISEDEIQRMYKKHQNDIVTEFSVIEIGEKKQYLYFHNNMKESINNIPYLEVINALNRTDIFSDKIISICINSQDTKTFKIAPVKKFVCNDYEVALDYLKLLARKEIAKNQIIKEEQYSERLNVSLEVNKHLFGDLQGKQENETGFYENWNEYIYYRITSVSPLTFRQTNKLKIALNKVYNEYCNQFFSGLEIFNNDNS